MRDYRIACFDAYYYQEYAKTCCIVFEIEPTEKIISNYCRVGENIECYIPGEFYKRELPGILELYRDIEEDINLIIIDGYVWLKGDKKGLGHYLYEALAGGIPVIGVAKSYYINSRNYIKVFRGQSSRPLYVSSIGINIDFAADFIQRLKGNYRRPNILKNVDRLTRM